MTWKAFNALADKLNYVLIESMQKTQLIIIIIIIWLLVSSAPAFKYKFEFKLSYLINLSKLFKRSSRLEWHFRNLMPRIFECDCLSFHAN